MIEVLRGALTRRMFTLFVALSILPALILLIVPTALRIQSERNARVQLENYLKEKAFTIFSNLAESKAEHYAQILSSRVERAITISKLFNLGYASYPQMVDKEYSIRTKSENNDLTNLFGGSLPILKEIIERDPAICEFGLKTKDHYITVNSASVNNYANPELELENNVIVGTTQIGYRDDLGYYLILTDTLNNTPNPSDYMYIKICIEKLIDEVPKYGLAENATLMLVTDRAEFVGLPSWGKSTYLIEKFKFPKEGERKTLLDIVPSDIRLQFKTQLLIERIEQKESFVNKLNFGFQEGYIASFPIRNMPLAVVLLLPLEDVYNFAAQYGANFQNEILTPLIQAAVSVIGFVIVVALGALYSLNGMAGSLNNLVHVATLVANGDFSQRVEESGPQEMIGFIRCFNKMIDSILEGQNSLQRKQAELTRTLQIREKEFRLMVSLSELITKTGSLYQKLDLALNAIASTLPLNDAMLFLYEENEFIQVAHTNPDPCLESSILYATLESAKEGKIYVVDHSTVSQCILAIPLTYREKILGVLLCLYPEPLNLTDPSISFLDAISKQVAILIENIRLQDQERSLLITEERNRLARELHDSVTQSLFSLIMIAEGLQIKSQELELPQSCSTGLEMLLKQAQQIQADLRSMIYELQPLSPKDLNLKDRIHYHMSKIENTMGIQTRIHLKGNLEEVPLMLQRNVDRILQEALSNVARHSHATLVEVEIELEENRLFISIADNGIGFDTASILQSSSSYGLMNMRERVELMGGTFSVKSSKSEGTIISAIIPLCTS